MQVPRASAQTPTSLVGSVPRKGVRAEASRPPHPPVLRLRLQARPESAPILRQRIALWLDELSVDVNEVYDVSLATTEAFVNAVEHPHEPSADVIEVSGSISDHTVSITIRDFGSWREEREREEGGYGFTMMRRLMDTVDVDRGADGTSITLRRRLLDDSSL
jgi:serine/threonine-protein kinase RsbW